MPTPFWVWHQAKVLCPQAFGKASTQAFLQTDFWGALVEPTALGQRRRTPLPAWADLTEKELRQVQAQGKEEEEEVRAAIQANLAVRSVEAMAKEQMHRCRQTWDSLQVFQEHTCRIRMDTWP